MVVRMVNIENVEFFIVEVISQMKNVLEILRDISPLIELQGVVQVKLMGGFDPFSQNAFFKAILDGKRRFLIGKGDIMPPLLQFPAETCHGVSGSCPFPIAKEVKDLHFGLPGMSSVTSPRCPGSPRLRDVLMVRALLLIVFRLP
jgi:hypothetical protein